MSESQHKNRKCHHCDGNGTIREINPAWLREVRKKKGISIRQMAKKLKLSAPFISDVELGRRRPNIKIISFIEGLEND